VTTFSKQNWLFQFVATAKLVSIEAKLVAWTINSSLNTHCFHYEMAHFRETINCVDAEMDHLYIEQ
jgi:hypothetical protein